MNVYESLSKREKEVLELYALGKNRKQITKELFISHTTVCSHIENIFSKLGINNKEKASIIFWQNNIEKLKNLNVDELM
jgi:DNA-binding NarL/FixJ family response regulator